MSSQVELMHRKRKKYRGGYVLGLAVFVVLWLLRVILRMVDAGSPQLHIGIMIGLIGMVVYLAYFALLINLLENRIRHDAALKEALNDELIRLNQ